MNYLAIIPARSGSKGVKDKNIKLLNGKPLMAYTIEAALKSGCFSEVHVSTDSELYKQVAEKYGASVPFLRDAVNAGDRSSSWDVVRECIEKYKRMGKEFDGFMLLQPTSPLRSSLDIVKAFMLLKEKQADSVVSLVEEEHSPLLTMTIPQNLDVSDVVNNPNFFKPRQEMPTFYRLNGAIYLSKMENFYKCGSIYNGKVVALKMSQSHSIDIDTELDFKLAEFFINESGEEFSL